MSKSHQYEVVVEWTGNLGKGTSGYRDYDRAHEVRAEGKEVIAGSSDPAFRGDPARWNPEELLLAALSQCHMLAFLHLASAAGIVVTDYVDTPSGTLEMNDNGSGQFATVTLRPVVTITDPSQADKTNALHNDAHAMCFIARSVNFPVTHEPAVK